MLSNSGQLRQVYFNALLAKNGVRKATAKDKEHGVAQKSPINNVENRL